MVQPSRRQCKDIAGIQAGYPVADIFYLQARSLLFTLFQCSVRSYCSQDRKFQYISCSPPDLAATQMDFFQISPSRSSCSLSPLLLCLCLLKIHQESNFRSNSSNNLHSGSSKCDNCAVSRRTSACQAL